MVKLYGLGINLSSKRPQFDVLVGKFCLHTEQKGLYFTQEKELPSKMIRCPFYVQKMRLSSFFARKIIFGVYFLGLI